MKKLLTLVIAVLMAIACCFALVGCNNPDPKPDPTPTGGKLKVALLLLNDENSMKDKRFIDEFNLAIAGQDIETTIVKNVKADSTCETKVTELANDGYGLIIATDLGHEWWVRKAVEANPNVQFCSLGGIWAKADNKSNFDNAFVKQYEARFVSGYATGLKLYDMETNGYTYTTGTFASKVSATNGEIKLGYVASFEHPQSMSAYTAWYLGVKAGYVAEGGTKEVVMDVALTNTVHDETVEKSKADALVADNCVLVAFEEGLSGVLATINEAQMPNIAHEVCNWNLYFKYCIEKVIAKQDVKNDWCEGFTDSKDTSAFTMVIGDDAAEGTATKLDEVIADLVEYELVVFDTDTYTISGGEYMTTNTYKVNVDPSNDEFDENGILVDGKPESQNGVGQMQYGKVFFQECEFRSAPYFDIEIDGIKIK